MAQRDPRKEQRKRRGSEEVHAQHLAVDHASAAVHRLIERVQHKFCRELGLTDGEALLDFNLAPLAARISQPATQNLGKRLRTARAKLCGLGYGRSADNLCFCTSSRIPLVANRNPLGIHPQVHFHFSLWDQPLRGISPVSIDNDRSTT